MNTSARINILNTYSIPHVEGKIDLHKWADNYHTTIDEDRLRIGNDVIATYSPGYGSGWSTWNDFNAADPIINLMVLTLKEAKADSQDMENLYRAIRENFPQYSEYISPCDPVNDIKIVLIDKDSRFRVVRNDGYEHIEYKDTVEWL